MPDVSAPPSTAPGPRTEPLYQTKAYLAGFAAVVVGHAADGVLLDRTAFYPGGGGQPPDRGELLWDGSVATVVGVARRDGLVVHLLREPSAGEPDARGGAGSGAVADPAAFPPVGTRLTGRIDWARRYGLMRTHTALHTLSGIIGRDHGAVVTGGAMDLLTARMDFELPAMSADFAARVEAALAREVAADRPVHVRFLSPEEFAAEPGLIRTKTNLVPPGLDLIRVIDIEGLDRQADGGTHVRSTAELGVVRVVGHESKGKGNKRLRIALDPREPPVPDG